MRVHLNQHGTQYSGADREHKKFRRRHLKLVILDEKRYQKGCEEDTQKRSEEKHPCGIEWACYRCQIPQPHNHQSDKRRRLNLSYIAFRAEDKQRRQVYQNQHRHHDNRVRNRVIQHAAQESGHIPA